MPDADRIGAIGEEFGEVCQALLEQRGSSLDKHPETSLTKELVQLAACCVAWLEAMAHAHVLADEARQNGDSPK